MIQASKRVGKYLLLEMQGRITQGCIPALLRMALEGRPPLQLPLPYNVSKINISLQHIISTPINLYCQCQHTNMSFGTMLVHQCIVTVNVSTPMYHYCIIIVHQFVVRYNVSTPIYRYSQCQHTNMSFGTMSVHQYIVTVNVSMYTKMSETTGNIILVAN